MLALGYVAMAAALATDLYLPAFPDIAYTFQVSPSAVQLTLTMFMLGAAVGQLFVGSLSDALGRKSVLVMAFSVFVVAAFLSSLSVSIEMLLVMRAIQGFSGASGAVIARAIISDLATPNEAARAFGALFAMMAFGPALANPLGAWLTELGGWRLALLGLSILAAGLLTVALFVIPESHPASRRQPFRAGPLLRNLLSLIRRPVFMAYVLAFGSGYAAMMVYIASSSFIGLGLFGLTPLQYSLTFTTGSVSFMLGALISGRLGARYTGDQLLRFGQLLQVAAGVMLLVSIVTALLLSSGGLVVWIAFLVMVSAGGGMIMSTASRLAISRAVGIAGAGSALVGFSQFVLAALGAPLGGLFGTDTALPTAVASLTLAVVSLLCGAFARSKFASKLP